MLFDIFINDINSEIKCAISKFADGPKLSDPEGQDTMQANSRSGPMRISCGSKSPSARCCTRVEAISNMSTDWELNSLKAAL